MQHCSVIGWYIDRFVRCDFAMEVGRRPKEKPISSGIRKAFGRIERGSATMSGELEHVDSTTKEVREDHLITTALCKSFAQELE